MIGLDTNVLARYYIDDDADAESPRQRSAARRLIESNQPLMVCTSVIRERSESPCGLVYVPA